jgi:biopolymer transport protein ExbB
MMDLALRQLTSIGGPVIVVLLLLSLAATAIAIVKIVQFFRLGVGRHGASRQALDLLQKGDPRAALETAAADGSCVSRVTARILASAAEPGMHLETTREDAHGFALDLLTALRRHVRTLDTIVQAAPMLGLLGTVLGMIDAFGKLELGGGSVDPSQLAGGIWVALLTTALGLAIAIPFYFVTAWLETRIDNERIAMETSIAMALARPAAYAARVG